jgi:hypothetical protein
MIMAMLIDTLAITADVIMNPHGFPSRMYVPCCSSSLLVDRLTVARCEQDGWEND